MKRLLISILVLSITLLSACASANPTEDQNTSSESNPTLVISGGETSKSYTRSDLEALPATQAAFKDVTYVGVTIAALLEDAGIDPTQVKAVKAVASDGYSLNYDISQLLADDIILAYARADGDLAEEDGAFRMVLPGAEGKLNARMLVELQIIK